jgi:mRNA interferase MazF
VQRGDVYRFKVPKGVGHEQHGDRYGVVVQPDVMLPRSVVVVAPTSRSAKPASFRPEVDVAGDLTRVLVEQLCAVDVHRLGRRVGRLRAEEMWSVDDALVVVLGLD